MKNKVDSILLLLLLLPFVSKAQLDNRPETNFCVSDLLHETKLAEDASYEIRHRILERQLYNSNNLPTSASTQRMVTHTIPVVVHVVHNNGPENISDRQVRDAIQHLNDAFENIGHYDENTGVDTEINFCLTSKDPENNPSNGINRIVSNLTNLTIQTDDAELKASQWNPYNHLNIWVVNEITSLSSGSGVAGYAYFPTSHGLPEDGIVIEANYFGSSQDNSKVLVHEAGHYLGLYHTFQDGCVNDDCQLDGDRICDTPPDQSTAPVNCDREVNTCNTDEDDTSINNPFRPIALGGLGDQKDMFINYMDYGYLPCYSAFTEGQKERMKTVLLTTRQSLLTSYSCQEPCPFSSFKASFSSNASSPVFVGDVVNFTNNSDNANFYEWRIEDKIFSQEKNSSYTFDREGIFTVELYVRDAINYCESSVEQVFEVVCEGEASFITESTEVIAGETIMTFKNTSSDHVSYQWFLDGSFYSADTDLNITFSTPGLYSLYLVGTTSTCQNYSATITINVDACTADDNREMHWYFGEYAALDFNNDEPKAISGSQLNSFENTSCISNDDGELLFYTNGLNIWDATNNVMPNGSGLLGGPETSARNQALVIPRPFNPDQYYVVTVDEYENRNYNGVRYSIVDMTLNGGLGDVTEVKNVFLCSTESEVLTAAYHEDGQKAWLIVRTEWHVLSSYLIDSNGIELAETYADPNDENVWGDRIFFNSGKRMAALRYFNRKPTFVMLDFDNASGVFSNPLSIPNVEDFLCQSFELSPDDSKLYAMLFLDENNIYGLYQFDLSLTTSQQIFNSRTLVKRMGYTKRLLLGPNGKIYHTNSNDNRLGVIHQPNQSAENCDHDTYFLDLSPGKNRLSLPKFIRGKRFSTGVNEPFLELGPDQQICQGLTTVLNPDGDENFHYLWQDGSTDPSYTAWLPGTYFVTMSNECGSVTDYINVELNQPKLVDLGDDIVTTNASVTLDAGTQGDFYRWQDGSTNNTLKVTEPGDYYVVVSTDEGCYESDTITVYISRVTDIFQSSLSINPNPSSGFFILQENNEQARNHIDFVIFDRLGRKVYERSELLERNLVIDLSNYAAGVYFLQWSSHSDSGVFKLISAE